MGAALFLAVLLLRLFSTPMLSEKSFSKVYRDRRGKLLRISLAGDEKYRVFTPLETIDPQLIEAFLLQEDRYFWWHPGINPIALLKVFVEAAQGERMRGASTITMQLVRLREGSTTRSVSSKFLQISKALWIEATHSKREILEAYLNLAPFGANIEGVGAASLIYFSKSALKLKLGELLTLALIPQSPSQRSLHKDANSLHEWKLRRLQLFDEWKAKHSEASEQEVDVDFPLASRRLKELPFETPHLVQRFERTIPGAHEVISSIDLSIQRFVEERVRTYLTKKQSLGVKNASVFLANYETGEVVAYVGSADFTNSEISGQVDGVVARRSPGSSLKPIVYALALEQGLVHTQSLLKDTPKNYGSFDPENFERGFLGPLSTEDALIRSRNIPAVELSSRLKHPNLYEFLSVQGIPLYPDPVHYGLSIALGGAELSLEELVRLYAGLARGTPIMSFSYLKGAKPRVGAWPLSHEATWLTLQMLSRNPRDGQEAFLKWSRSRLNAAWKTGTSSAFRDAWTIGVFGPYALGIWIGNFDGESNAAFVGREIAAPLFFDIAEGLSKNENFDDALWAKPYEKLNVKRIEVCALSGAEPEPFCPHRKTAWIIPGKSPIEHCKIHRSIFVNRKSGRRACGAIEDPKLYRPEIFEFWPSDLKESLTDFGIHKAAPPEFEETCRDRQQNDAFLSAHRPPEIISPRKEVVYSLRLSETPDQRRIPLQAISDGDAKRIDWFADATYLGSVETGKTLFWQAPRGKHLITVVDESGSSQTQTVEVQYVP
ncbi:MAG: penicillin-binding protein 1C [Bdellovibrionota bacterium]